MSIVAVDFSPNSVRALDEALELTSARGGELHVVHVEPETPADLLLATPLIQPEIDGAVEKVQRRAQERIDAVTARHGPLALMRVVIHVVRGSPAPCIAELAASLDADLVVVGSHGRHGVERLLLGSVAERVLHLARCPVWIVRPKDHEPVCPDCLARREATGGAELQCARHAERYVQPPFSVYATKNLSQ